MTVDSIGSSGSAYSQSIQSGQASAFRQRRQDFDALSQALGSGDIAAAQSAFASLQQATKNAGQGQGAQQTAPSSVQDAMSALAKALSSGDLSGAQSAFATLKQDMQSARPAHHHHHHAGNGQQSSATGVAAGSGDAQSSGISTKA